MTFFSPTKLRLVTRHLTAGEVIAYPTESVYGLGCDPLNGRAVFKLLQLKQRPMSKGLILIAADFSQLAPFLACNASMLERVLPTWPGAVTWVMPAQAWVPRWLTGTHHSLAVRVTAHPLAQALCQAFGGAIVSTSANPSTQKPARRPLQVRRYFGSHVKIWAGATGGNRNTSLIYEARTGRRLR